MSKQPRAFANALPFRHATAFVTFYRANLRGDKHNLPAGLKPVWDGLQVERKRRSPKSPAWIGAGLIRDDRGLGEITFRYELDRKNPRVEISLELE